MKVKVTVLTFHYCDQIAKKVNLKEKNFLWLTVSEAQSMLLDSEVSGLVGGRTSWWGA